MAFRLLDLSEIRKALIVRRPKLVAAKPQKPGYVTLSVANRQNGAQQLIISRRFNALLDGVKRVALEYDDEARVLAIRPALEGESSLSLLSTGYDRPGSRANRTVPITRVRKYLGIEDNVKGQFNARIKDGRLLVDLKPAFKKTAAKAA